MAFLTDYLLKKSPYEYNEQEKKAGLFYDSVMEEIKYHYENNELYRKFCVNKEFDPYEFTGAIEDIPPVQVSVFKHLGNSLSSVKSNEIKLTLQSSATSGVPSSILVDKVTSKRQAKAMVKVVSSFIGNERKPFLIMDVNPAEGFREILGARFAAVSGYLKFASKMGYFLKANKGNQYYFNIESIKEYIDNLKAEEPAVVFGFTYILYSEVISPLYDKKISFKLPNDSKIIHIGGWKKLENEKISKEEFNKKAAFIFGIKPENVIDIYGFTEQMGLNYPDCKCGCKHTSLYSEVIVRDAITKEICPDGKEGMLEFITPIPHSYPGNAVLTDDIGVIDSEPCPYGLSGKRFRIIGRLKKAEIRGCGDILSSKLKFIDRDGERNKVIKNSFHLEYYRDKDIIQDTTPKSILIQIEKNLRDRLAWLREQPVDVLIGLISQVAKKWNATDADNEKIINLQMNGLGFLSSWCSPEHLTNIISDGLHENRMHIDGFLPVNELGIQYRKAVSKGLACHWLAGNVQVLGMFVLIESILTKNVNLIKVSSRDDGIFAYLLSAFEDEVYTAPSGYTIKGDDLLKTIAVVYYNHDNAEIGEQMSKMADIRVAWGGSEAVMTVAGYPSKFDCSDLVMGPKLSYSVISAEALSDEHKTKKLARKVAVDASVFDQTGCASAHNVFVEKGGAYTPAEFARYLADGMRKVAIQIPKGQMSVEQISAIHSMRGVYDFKGTVYGDSENVWTVLYCDDLALNPPVYSRVVFVHPAENINDILQFVNEDIQTIGLAAVGSKALDFASKAADRGAVRFPQCGKMLNFDSPWDGMYLVDRMVKWVTIGGPLV